MKSYRFLNIPEPVTGDEGYVLVSFCVPNSRGWRGVATYLVNQLTYGRNWDESTGSVVDAISVGRDIFATMSICNLDELLAAVEGIGGQLANINQTLTSTSCGCGAGGSGSEEQPASTENTGVPGNQTGDPPPGYPTWDDYNSAKCAIANDIVYRLQKDVDWLAELDVFTITGTVLLVSIVSPIPGDEIIAAVAFLVALGVIYSDVLGALQDAIGASLDDLVCALYYTDTASSSKSAYEQVAYDAIDGETSNPLWSWTAKRTFDIFCQYDGINKMYDDPASYATLGSVGVDCTTCAPVETIEVVLGSTQDALDPDVLITVQSEFKNGFHRIFIRQTLVTCPGVLYDWEVITSAALDPGANNDSFVYVFNGTCTGYNTSGPNREIIPVGVYPGVGISQISDDQPFLMVFRANSI